LQKKQESFQKKLAKIKKKPFFFKLASFLSDFFAKLFFFYTVGIKKKP